MNHEASTMSTKQTWSKKYNDYNCQQNYAFTIIVLYNQWLANDNQPTSVGFNQSFKSTEKSFDIRPTASVRAIASRTRSWSSSGYRNTSATPSLFCHFVRPSRGAT